MCNELLSREVAGGVVETRCNASKPAHMVITSENGKTVRETVGVDRYHVPKYQKVNGIN